MINFQEIIKRIKQSFCCHRFQKHVIRGMDEDLYRSSGRIRDVTFFRYKKCERCDLVRDKQDLRGSAMNVLDRKDNTIPPHHCI